jgi:hypothetical protein
LEGSLGKVIVNRVSEVVVGDPGHPDQFPYINCWQDAIFSQPMWLKSHLEKACRFIVARMAKASKCREKCKKPEKPMLVGDPEETLPPYVALYPSLSAPSPPPSEGEAASDRLVPAANTPTRLGPEVLETATTPLSSGPLNLMLTPSPLVLTPQLPVRLAPRFN